MSASLNKAAIEAATEDPPAPTAMAGDEASGPSCACEGCSSNCPNANGFLRGPDSALPLRGVELRR